MLLNNVYNREKIQIAYIFYKDYSSCFFILDKLKLFHDGPLLQANFIGIDLDMQWCNTAYELEEYYRGYFLKLLNHNQHSIINNWMYCNPYIGSKGFCNHVFWELQLVHRCSTQSQGETDLQEWKLGFNGLLSNPPYLIKSRILE